MTCASCANRIERKLNKLDGVTATVNYATEKAKVSSSETGRTGRPGRHRRGGRLHGALRAAGDRPAQPTTDRRTTSATLRLRLVGRAALTVPVVALAMVPALQFTGWQWVVARRSPRRSWSGARGRSTAPPGPTCGTAPTTMDTLVSLGRPRGVRLVAVALFLGTAGARA